MLGSITFQSHSKEDLEVTLSEIQNHIHETYDIKADAKEAPSLSKYVTDRVKTSYFISAAIISIVLAVVASAALWNYQTDYLKLSARTTSNSLIEPVVNRETFIISQVIGELGYEDLVSKITVTDSSNNVLYSNVEIGLPSYLATRKVDPKAFSFNFPIRSDGFIHGYLYLEPDYIKALLPILYILMTVIIVMAMIYTIAIKFILPKAFDKAEKNLKQMSTLLSRLKSELSAIPTLKFNNYNLLEAYKNQFNGLKTNFREIEDIKSFTGDVLMTLQLIQIELDEKNKLSELFQLQSKQVDQLNLTAKSEKDNRRMLQEIASQIAHDIRSPLAALELVSLKSEKLPEELRTLIRTIIARLKDISSGLVSKNQEDLPKHPLKIQSQMEAAAQPELISSIVEEIVAEKRLLNRHLSSLEISFVLNNQSYGLFALVQKSELKRCLSNLLDNAVEAITTEGLVEVSLDCDNTYVIIKVRDNGKGVDPLILPKLSQRGATFGKVGGSGLGLYHAKKKCTEWNGKLNISSELLKGTTVSIHLPTTASPRWFKDSLSMSTKECVLILDDDKSIHRVWRERFSMANTTYVDTKLFHAMSVSDFESNLATLKANGNFDSLHCLLDFELIGQGSTGLDLIEEFHLQSKSTLVTSYYENDSVRARCARLGVPIIPKGLAPFIPISIKD